MGAEQSYPTTTSSQQAQDPRPALNRWLDPYDVFSAAPTSPHLRQQNPRTEQPLSPSSSSAAPTASSAYMSLDMSGLEEVDLNPTQEDSSEQEQIQETERQQQQPVGPFDAAMARIAPPQLAQLLRSPAVSGEMAFASEAAQKSRKHSEGAGGSTAHGPRMMV